MVAHSVADHIVEKFNALLRWVAAFLEGRTQFISLMDATSTARVLNGGIPWGTKLGPLLFAIMVNDLVSSWVPRAKYVDDLTVLEVVLRNSPSIDYFPIAHNTLCLPPKFCITYCLKMLLGKCNTPRSI